MKLTVSLGSGDDVSGRLAHDVHDVQWAVGLASNHDRTMSRLRLYLVTMTTTSYTAHLSRHLDNGASPESAFKTTRWTQNKLFWRRSSSQSLG